MENLQSHFNRILKEELVTLTLSNKQIVDQEIQKVVVRPVVIKGQLLYQMETFSKTQAFHKNLTTQELLEQLTKLFETNFKQMNGATNENIFQLKRSKKGKLFVSFTKKQANEIKVANTHNKQKKYILEEGTPVPALVELGVMTPDGKVKREHYNKFKQINKFLELIAHSVKDETKPLHIVDFGCGKSYLTFVVYYYFTQVKKQKITMVGLDLKEDVIKHCQSIAQKFGYKNLNFQVGDIAQYETSHKVDMVITLHACDTATDIAMYHAVKWGVEYLFSVPCCQHEVNAQIESEALQLITNYGILKERFSAIATDSIRAALLESVGYKVDVVEFVDLAHSPKNLLIRCKKGKVSKEKAEQKKEQVESLLKTLNSQQTLYHLLKENHYLDK